MKTLSQNYSSAEESPGFLLWQVTHLWQRKINTALKDQDLTHMQFVLLANIADKTQHAEGITQVQLAQRTQIHIMMVSQVIRTLEKKGFVKRIPSKKDPRANEILITPEGFKKAIQAIKTVEEIDVSFFKFNKEELSTFNTNLKFLITNNS